MTFVSHYDSPLGRILLAGDEQGLSGLWFEGAKYFAAGLAPEPQEGELPVFDRAKAWLDLYFGGADPDFLPPLHVIGTPFQSAVWELLLKIPYGETTTYGELAKAVAARMGLARMSAQAVGGAVGRNPVSLMIPCHRVLGANGSLTGYAGGVEKKRRLLDLEKYGGQT